ncbi:MAG: hypothetical protein SFV51_15890 [Bryobacteraceae bacterium]|nr:hypothetical protein [Bryobacteraceae bacterium]
MKTRITILLAAAMAIFAASAPAETRRGERARNQQARIRDGVQDGSLTRRETRKIERREADLARDARRMKATGGALTPAEKARIEARQDRLSRKIYKQKHDSQNRR